MKLRLFWGKSLRFQRHRQIWGISLGSLFFGVMREHPFAPWVYEKHTEHQSGEAGAARVTKTFAGE